LEEEVGRIETVSNELKELFRTTTQDIKDLRTRTIAELDSKIASSSLAVDDKKTEILSELNTATTNAINQINNKKEEVLQLISDNNLVTNDMFTGFQNDIQESMDETLGEYLSQVNAVRDDFQLTLDNLDWQKYKFVEDSGVLQSVSLANDLEALHSLKTGLHYRTAVPIDNYELSSKAGFLTVIETNVVKHILFRPYNSKRQFLKRFYNSWNDWEEVGNNQSDTGWVTFDLINGALSNTAYKNEGDGGFDCAYRTITNGSEVTKKLRINGTNLTPNQVIAQLPSNFAKNAQAFPVRVPNSSAGGYIVIRPSGRVNFYISGDSSNWTETGYAYGECTWHD